MACKEEARDDLQTGQGTKQCHGCTGANDGPGEETPVGCSDDTCRWRSPGPQAEAVLVHGRATGTEVKGRSYTCRMERARARARYTAESLHSA